MFDKVKNIELLYKYNIDFNGRAIYLLNEVDDTAICEFIKAIHYFSNEDPGPIDFYINSEGGCLESSFALYDTIQQLNPKHSPVYTIGTGQMASAALLLLACGHRRFATENSWSMAHAASTMTSGDADTVVAQSAVVKAMNDRMWHLLSRHTKKNATQWAAMAKEVGEVWMVPEDMLKYGVVDEIIPHHPNRKFRKPRVRRTAKKVIKKINKK